MNDEEALEVIDSISPEKKREIAKDNLRMLRLYISGRPIKRIARDFGVPPSEVEYIIDSTKNDLDLMKMEDGAFDGMIAEMLLEEIRSLSKLDKEITGIVTLKFQALDKDGNIHDLTKEEGNADLKIKAKDEKLRYLKELRQIVAINERTRKDDDSGLAEALVKELSQIATEKGRVEQKLNESKTVDAEFEVIDGE